MSRPGHWPSDRNYSAQLRKYRAISAMHRQSLVLSDPGISWFGLAGCGALLIVINCPRSWLG